MLGRPVKLAMTRPQTLHEHRRPGGDASDDRLGADRDGMLQSIVHRGVNETSMDGMWVEQLGSVASIMYATPNFSSQPEGRAGQYRGTGRQARARRNPRAFGIECAIDELAHEVGIDPLEIRLLNYAEQDPTHKKAWSTRQSARGLRRGRRRPSAGRRRGPRRVRCVTADS